MSDPSNEHRKTVDMIVRRGVVYVSKVTTPFSYSQLRKLTDESTENNNRLGITGFLYYDHGRFLQYLEGREQQLMELLRKIRMDKRHHIIYTRVSVPLTTVRFPDWNMQYLDPAALVSVNLKGVLMDYLSYAQDNLEQLFREETDEKVWNLVDKIAQAKAVLN